MMSHISTSKSVLFVVLAFSVFASPVAFAINNGTAVVDGDTSEWTADDYYAPMYRAGNPGKAIESLLYLRYDCDSSTLYVLVETVDGVVALQQDSDAYMKYKDDPSANTSVKGVGGGFSSFAWVYNTNNELIGWEGSFQIAPGEYTVNAHVQVWDDGASQTSATSAGSSNDRFIPLSIDCGTGNPDDDNNGGGDDDNNNVVETTYSISGTVFVDNAPTNGVLDSGEAGLGGVTVTLIDSNGDVVAVTVSDANGNYVFGNLAEGDYTVYFPSSFNNGNEFVTEGSTTAAVSLNGADSSDNNFGYIPVFDIAGTIYVDNAPTNENFDSGEGVLAGVTVTLVDLQGNVIATTVSDADGNYVFENLREGSYIVQVPEKYTNGSDEYIISGLSSQAVVLDGADSVDNDFGFIPVYDVSGFAFIDANQNGGYDANEPALSNVTVVLYDGDGNLIDSVTTDADGHYVFEDLVNGDYTIVIPEATGFFPDDINEDLYEHFDPTTSTSIEIVDLSADSNGNNAGFAPDLTSVDYTGTGKTIGYWKHQHSVAIRGKGKAHVDAVTLQSYLDQIEELFLEDPFQFDDTNEFQSSLDVLDSTSSDAADLLKKQLLGTELNQMDGRGINDSQLQSWLIQWGEYIAANPGEFERAAIISAKDVFDTINNTGE